MRTAKQLAAESAAVQAADMSRRSRERAAQAQCRDSAPNRRVDWLAVGERQIHRDRYGRRYVVVFRVRRYLEDGRTDRAYAIGGCGRTLMVRPSRKGWVHVLQPNFEVQSYRSAKGTLSRQERPYRANRA